MTRIGRELEALGRDEEAVATYRDIIDLAGPRHYLRRELTERIVDIHRRGQDIKSLVADYDRRWPVGKRGHFEWDVMARLHEAEGDQEAALAAYAQAVASAPTELETQRRYIALLELTGRTSEALAQVEKVARIAPGDPRFQLELAERYFRAGHRSAALATLRRMTARFGGEPSVQGALAELYRRWGEEKLAIEAYERVVRIEPGDPTHLENLGEQYFQKGEKKRAVQVWKRIAAAGTPEATARLAEVYAEHDMGPEAIETYLRAIELGPGDPELLRGLATTLERQQNLDRARQVWGEILEVTAGDPGHKALRREARTRVVALLARQPGRPLLAQANRWQAAWNREPPDIEAGYSLVEAYLKLDRDEAAQTVLTRLLELRPEDADALHQLAQVRRALGELDGAIAVYRRLAELQPSREREYLNHIAGLELLLYRDDRALASARKARDKHPNDPVVHERLGEIFERTEDWNEAASAYRRVLELDHRNFEVRRKLARLYLRQGKHREAAHEYRDMLALSSSEELVAAIAPTAIDLEEYLGTLAELEAHLAPLALAHPDKPVYRRMLVRLYERLVPGLAKQARRGDEKARASLVAMGEHGLRPLLEALADQEDPDQQRIAVELIGHLGNRGATSALVRLARSDASARAEPDPGTRRMLRLRTGASHMDLRASAIRAIGFLGDPGARPALTELTRHEEKSMRMAALWALGRIGSSAAIGPVMHATSDMQPDVRRMACQSLAMMGTRTKLSDAALATVRVMAADGDNPDEVRAACVITLGVVRDKRAREDLETLVKRERGDLQDHAVWALGALGDTRAADVLTFAWFTAHESLRPRVVEALASLGASPASPAFEGDDAWELPLPRPGDVPSEILEAGASGLVQGLETALAGSHDTAHRALSDLASGALATRLGSSESVLPERLRRRLVEHASPAVVEISGRGAPELRALAVVLAARWGLPEAPRRIAEALDARDIDVRLAGLQAATELGEVPPEVADAVAARLDAAPWNERAAAARALGALATGRARALPGARGHQRPVGFRPPGGGRSARRQGRTRRQLT